MEPLGDSPERLTTGVQGPPWPPYHYYLLAVAVQTETFGTLLSPTYFQEFLLKQMEEYQWDKLREKRSREGLGVYALEMHIRLLEPEMFALIARRE
jgi:hypothetical protein